MASGAGTRQAIRAQAPMVRRLALLLAASFASTSCDGDGADDGIATHVEFVWPTVVTSTMLEVPKGENFNLAELLRELAQIGEDGFLKYINKVLPRELKLDKEFAEEFESEDASRLPLGFFRWQKRVFHKVAKIRLEELLWDGKPIPELPGVEYSWDEFHRHDKLKSIIRMIRQQALYYQKAGEANIPDANRGLRIIRWVEVFRPREFLHPHTHTGQFLVGTICLRCEGSQRIVFEDPRGINPPYGRKRPMEMKTGEVLMFPSWASHFVDPNAGNTTNVYLNFAIQGRGGPNDMDWEDDETGNVIKRTVKKLKVKRKATKEERTEL